MKKLLLSAATLMLGLASMNAQIVKDPAIYTPVDGYELRSLWTQSGPTNNNTSLLDKLGVNPRGMAVLNGKILFCKRTADNNAPSIVVYDGATGAFEKEIPLAANVFTKTDGTAVSYPCNDIHVDDAGHVLVSNMALNLQTNNFQVWSINLNDGSGTKVMDCLYPDLSSAKYRIDAFGVYGDVTGNGYLMAAIQGAEANVSDQVFRWDITGGVISEEPTPIKIKSYFPAIATTNGTAPRVTPVDNDLFYLDAANCAATLYDMAGIAIDDFSKALDCAPLDYGNNGVDEFTINGKKFITYVYASYAKTPQAWNLCELGEGASFTGMKKYFQYPQAGIGQAKNDVFTAVPYIEVNKAGTVATIYVYAKGNGAAAYQFGLTKDLPIISGINQTNTDATLKVKATANGIELSEAANVEVFNFAGQQVAVKENADKVVLTPGMYIVKAITAEGNVVTAKVNVK